MNILPFVAIFLILLGLFSSSFLSNAHLFFSEKKSSIGFLEAKRSMLTNLQATAYKKLPRKKEEPKSDGKKPSPDIKVKEEIEDLDSIAIEDSSREKSTLEPINLYLLFEEKVDPLLKKIYFNLFQNYYGHTSFYQNSPLATDLSSFIEKIKKEAILKMKECEKAGEKVDSLSLVDFYPKDGPSENLYYKLLKGTYTYDLESKIGCPPLQKAFCFHTQKNKKVFPFHFLTKSMLAAVFGEIIAEDIVQKEGQLLLQNPKRKPKTLQIEELKELLHKKHPTFKEADAILEYLEFGQTSSTKEELIITDTTSQVTLKEML